MRQGLLLKGTSYRKDFLFFLIFFFSPTFPIVFLSCAVAEQSDLYRKIPTRSDTSAAARSPPPLQPLSSSASHTHFNLKSEPEVPCVLKSLLLWHPPSLGLSPPLHSSASPSSLQWHPCPRPVPAGCLQRPWGKPQLSRASMEWNPGTGKGRRGKGFQHRLETSVSPSSPSCPAAGFASPLTPGV